MKQLQLQCSQVDGYICGNRESRCWTSMAPNCWNFRESNLGRKL
ncbi:hypothetical protein LINPERPRIM_LOCUS5984 [Linum perenne]